MRTAKEWAESVVDYLHGASTWDPALKDDKDFVVLESSEGVEGPYAREVIADARAIIERLVERVQADARAPLEAEIARLREELRVASAAAYGASSLASDRSYELESLRRENDMLRRISRGAPR